MLVLKNIEYPIMHILYISCLATDLLNYLSKHQFSLLWYTCNCFSELYPTKALFSAAYCK